MATQIEENVEPFKCVWWKDVEFEDKIFRLYHSIQMHKNKFTEQPKCPAGGHAGNGSSSLLHSMSWILIKNKNKKQEHLRDTRILLLLLKPWISAHILLRNVSQLTRNRSCGIYNIHNISVILTLQTDSDWAFMLKKKSTLQIIYEKRKTLALIEDTPPPPVL